MSGPADSPDSGWRPGRKVLLAAVLVGLVGIGALTAGVSGDVVSTATDIFGNEAEDESLSTDHVDAVTDEGSATTTVELRREADSETVSIERTTELDFEAGERTVDNRLVTSTLGGLVSTEPLRVQQYETPTDTYTKTSSSLVEANYTHHDESGGWDENRALYANTIDDATELDWTRQGQEQHDGTDVTRYTIADADKIEDSELNLTLTASATQVNESGTVSLQLGNVTVTDASGTMLVDDDGIVRQLRYEVELDENGESVTYVAVLSFSDIGETTVTPPEWTTEAENAR